MITKFTADKINNRKFRVRWCVSDVHFIRFGTKNGGSYLIINFLIKWKILKYLYKYAYFKNEKIERLSEISRVSISTREIGFSSLKFLNDS